jgi:hypothetical protein
VAVTLISTLPQPAPLGKLLPGANFATASIRLDSNYASAPLETTNFRIVSIRANYDNSKPLYICTNSSQPDTANFTNVIDKIYPGESYPRSPDWGTLIDISQFYIGAENALDHCWGWFSQ